jgi:hypothetical protein
MTEIKLYKTSSKGLKLVGMSIPFVLIGIWMITKEPFGTFDYFMGWICTCFFGLGIPIGLYQTFDKQPQIIINENGVWDRTTRQDEIKWEQVIEAYPLDIFGQKFISIVADKTFVFKKKQNKWAARINKKVGAQQLNLHLGQINIDANKLTGLINDLSKANREDREKLIQSFKFKKIGFSQAGLFKILLYISTSIALLLLSLTGLTALMTIMIIMGLSALTARWYWGSNDNSRIRKYAGIITWFGLINMVLFLITLKSFEYVSNKVGYKTSNELENYKSQYSDYPSDLNSVSKNLELNIFEKHIMSKIEYDLNTTDYQLTMVNLLNKKKQYNRQLKEWK